MSLGATNLSRKERPFGQGLKKCAWHMVFIMLAVAIFSDSHAQPAKVRIGLAGRNFSFLPFYVAEQRKFFDQEGIRTEMIYMRSPVAIPALSAGEIQYTTHFASVVRTAVSRGRLQSSKGDY